MHDASIAQEGAPRAGLNYLFFDKGMNLLPMSGVLTLGGLSPNVFNSLSMGEPVAATEPGYLIVYVDNQSLGKDVWFDNIQILHYNAEVQEETHYYPFGLTLSSSAIGNEQPYKYNGKELETKFDLQTYEYGARQYNSQIGRWNGIDPLADRYFSISPFAYVANNPIIYIDPDGRKIVPALTSSFTYNEPRYIGDLGVTDYRYRSVGLRSGTGVSLAYNSVSKEYDMTVPVYINYSRAFAPDGTGALEQQNPRLFEQTKAHEEGHKDQFIEAASLDVTVSVSIGGKDQEFTGRGDQVMTNIKTS
jgi:RHS repeat-associated protein